MTRVAGFCFLVIVSDNGLGGVFVGSRSGGEDASDSKSGHGFGWPGVSWSDGAGRGT